MSSMHMTLFQIMAVLSDGPGEAAGVLEHLTELGSASRPPSVPSFYRHLRRGMEKGWIEVEGTSDVDQPGRPAQTYALTPAGEDALRARGRELAAFTRLALGEG